MPASVRPVSACPDHRQFLVVRQSDRRTCLHHHAKYRSALGRCDHASASLEDAGGRKNTRGLSTHSVAGCRARITRGVCFGQMPRTLNELPTRDSMPRYSTTSENGLLHQHLRRIQRTPILASFANSERKTIPNIITISLFEQRKNV